MARINEDHIYNYYAWGWIDPQGKIYNATENKKYSEAITHGELLELITGDENISGDEDSSYFDYIVQGWTRWMIPSPNDGLFFDMYKKVNSEVKRAIWDLAREYAKIISFVHIDVIKNSSGTLNEPLEFENLRQLRQYLETGKKPFEGERAFAVGESESPKGILSKYLTGLTEEIVKRSDGYYLISKKTGRNLGGPYETREQALKRERQVQFFKHLKKKSHK